MKVCGDSQVLGTFEGIWGVGVAVSCMQTVAGTGMVLLGHEYLLPPALLALNVERSILRQVSSL